MPIGGAMLWITLIVGYGKGMYANNIMQRGAVVMLVVMVPDVLVEGS